MLDKGRREFMTLLGGAAAVWPLAARAADGISQPLSVPADSTMNSEAWNFQYSPNMPAHPTDRDATGWEFNFPPRDGVHYLVHPVIGCATYWTKIPQRSDLPTFACVCYRWPL